MFPPHEISHAPTITQGWHKIENFFCVKAGNFARKTKTKEAHYQCPPDYFQQLFNVAGFTTSYTDLTLNLQ